MGKLRITPLLQAQLIDEIAIIRRSMDVGWVTEAFNSLETLVSMLNKEDGDKLLKEVSIIKKHAFLSMKANSKFDRVSNFRAQQLWKNRIFRNHVRPLFRKTMILMYEHGYMEDTGAKPKYSKKAILTVPQDPMIT